MELINKSEPKEITNPPVGVEEEQPNSDEQERIAEPFNPDDIDVITRSMTVDLLLSRTESEMINLQPDFQRRWGVWDPRRQSRLIESLLLRIPLPVLYAAEDDDESWEIVDGIQRLSTIARFIKPQIIGEEPLTLTGLEYLRIYDGKQFEDLNPRLKMRLRETELVIHLIRKGTPPEVKFNIFARINTGGMALSAQELRHAIVPGRARDRLKKWASLSSFVNATDGSIRPARMDDRELVLRFIAFYVLGLDSYKQPDMDGFLIKAMNAIDDIKPRDLGKLKLKFMSSMKYAKEIFGNDAFRKRFDKNASRLPINKALFEAISVNLAHLSTNDLDKLIEKRDEMREMLIELCNDRLFEISISQGTGDVRKVRRRFDGIKNIISKVLNNDI